MQIGFVDDLQPLTPASFDHIKKREFDPERGVTGLKYLRDMAGRERDLRELYRGRAPYELLQNADDSGASIAVFSLASDGVAFAHNGRWFNISNFRSLADGWSDKNPNECIGHKGLGFRSVLDITPSPYLLRVDPDFFAVKFGWSVNNNHVQQILARNKDLKDLYRSWGKNGQRVCPVMSIPAVARKESLGGGLTILNRFLMSPALGLSTMFWLPARDLELPPQIAEELSTEPLVAGIRGRERLLSFLADEVDVVLPFLSNIRKIIVLDGNTEIGQAAITVVSRFNSQKRIRVNIDTQTDTRQREFFQMSFACQIPSNVSNAPGTPKALRQLRQGAGLKLAVHLVDGQPQSDLDACFHVYFPTEEKTGFGFLVHGDFHVAPDRKRLIQGEYNNWLFKQAARHAANDFLSALLESNHAERVFSALAPTGRSGARPNLFGVEFAKSLTERKVPFIPVSTGKAPSSEVVLAPACDTAEFWEEQFSAVLPQLRPGKKNFLSHECDSVSSRTFLRFAGVDVLDRESLVAYVESAGSVNRSADWWYDCYSRIVHDEKLARCGRSTFINRYLIPSSAGQVLATPGEEGMLVCLHPDLDKDSHRVPLLFAQTFSFVDKQLSELLEEGSDEVSSWILNRLHISRFEASDLIPRAVRAASPKLFDGTLEFDVQDLIDAWRFLRELVERSRAQFSDEFWMAVSRMPVIAASADMSVCVPRDQLIPCTAAYWPDELLPEYAAIADAKRLRRIHIEFVSRLAGEMDLSAWLRFLSRAGIGDAPRLVRYARFAAGTEEIFVRGQNAAAYKAFNGERQHDVNRAIADAIACDPDWDSYVGMLPDCGHGVQRVVQSLSVIEGLCECSELAQKEHESNDDHWHVRLSSLMSRLYLVGDEHASDSIYCRAGRQGGHTSPVPNYAGRQLERLRWLPSTAGPAGIGECFMRRTTHKLISDTRSRENVNDWLLPSVIVDDLELFVRISKLGVAVLEDSTASSPVLVRVLRIIGERLSQADQIAWVFDSPARWRAIRGAIQEVYRTLNQRNDIGQEIRLNRFAMRGRDSITFTELPLYYAEPGPVRDAFCGVLPLIDADRYYAALFDHLGVVQLTPGVSVRELLTHDGEATRNAKLRQDIVEGLAPYLLALTYAKSDSQEEQQTRRTLAERFDVICVPRLAVQFELVSASAIKTVSSPPLPFYLQRRLVEKSGAINEAHYTLFVSGAVDQEIYQLDADALGTALVPVFQDHPAADITAMFARVAIRFKEARGAELPMKEFMYTHLGVSLEVLEATTPEPGSIDEATVQPPAPPPATIVGVATAPGQESDTLTQVLERQQEELNNRAADVVKRVAHSAHKSGAIPPNGTGQGPEPISAQQSARGLAGEEEIMRRLRLPDGWEGFTFTKDTRNDRCGYDFEAQFDGRGVRLEVKTFTLDGRVIVTNRELQMAAEYKSDYFLVGVQDSPDVLPSRWNTFLLCNPLLRMMSLGEFVIEAKLQVDADELFEFKTEVAGLNEGGYSNRSSA